MKKTYVKPELNAVCFDLNEDIVVASNDEQGALDLVANGFEKMANGVLNFFSNIGNG